MPDEPLGLGLIGCGVIARTYLHELRRPEQSEWRLAAVCDTDLEKARAAAGDGAAAYADVERLLADPAVDAVAILLPNHQHAEAALRALDAGKPVLVEKPMATTLEECDRMIAAAERAGADPLWAHAAIRNRSGVWADDTGVATLGLADGTLIQFQTDGLATQCCNETVLHGTEATVTVTQTRVVVHRQPEPEVTEFPS